MLASDKGGDFTPCAVGMHGAVCYGLIDLGIQVSTIAGYSDAHKIILKWEIDDMMDNGKRFMISKFFTLSLGTKANLRQALESWRAKPFTKPELDGFDIEVLVGVPCMLNIIHNETGKAVISAITPLPKGMERLQPENKLEIYDITKPNKEVYENQSDRIKEMIDAGALELARKAESTPPPTPQTLETDLDDQIPF